jgi:subtilisin family serine protease
LKPAPAAAAAAAAAALHLAGTACAGIMAARHSSGDNTPVGVMSSASLVSCKMMNASGGYSSDAADCMYDMMAKDAAAVLSNSWGDAVSTAYLEEAVAYACQHGV